MKIHSLARENLMCETLPKIENSLQVLRVGGLLRRQISARPSTRWVCKRQQHYRWLLNASAKRTNSSPQNGKMKPIINLDGAEFLAKSGIQLEVPMDENAQIEEKQWEGKLSFNK